MIKVSFNRSCICDLYEWLRNLWCYLCVFVELKIKIVKEIKWDWEFLNDVKVVWF